GLWTRLAEKWKGSQHGCDRSEGESISTCRKSNVASSVETYARKGGCISRSGRRVRTPKSLTLTSLTKQGQALISEVYHSARQLIVLELELVLELGTVAQASAETLTHRKPNNVPLVPEPNSQQSRTSSRTRTIFKIWRPN